jgi:hypothetical protein
VTTAGLSCSLRPSTVATVIWALAASIAPSFAKAQAPPDLNGVWVIADSFMDRQDGKSVAAPGRLGENHGVRPHGSPVLKGEYAERLAAQAAAQAAGKPYDEPTARCLPQGVPRFWSGPYAFEILQTPYEIHLSQEWNAQTRRIYLDGRGHPADLDPSYNGHSIARWEGQTLVVDTVGLTTDSLVNGEGAPHSDALHITERMHLEPEGLLDVQVTSDDSKAFAEPWRMEYRLKRKPGMEIQEYVCEQNNRTSPSDPISK